MDINELKPNQFIDLFAPVEGQSKAVLGHQTPVFGKQEGMVKTADLFNPQLESPSTGDTTTQAPVNQPSTGDTTTQKPADEPKDDEEKKEPDLFGDTAQDAADKAKTGRPVKYDFSDISGYIQDRQKKGKFVGIEDEEGKPFVPKTPEDFDEVFDIQVNYKVSEKLKDLDKTWYNSKSPAWKAIGQYAELVDDPTELIPFLQGVKTIQSVAGINEEEVEGAEKIIRIRMEQRGDPDDVIQENIDSLKQSNNLVSTAKKYKPIILQQEQQSLQAQQREKVQQDQEYLQMVSAIREGAIKAIEEPIFGKQKLRQEEKALIYNLIAEPSSEDHGYAIFTAIDKLFEKGDFKTLTKVALLLGKEDAFLTYHGVDVANNTHAGLDRKLKVAGETRSSVGNNNVDEEPVTKVQRNQFNQNPRFGFSPKG